MIVITGPQGTAEEQGELAEIAGLHGAALVGEHNIKWASVVALYRIPGWERCPLALADVAMADALDIPTHDLTG
ncbi:hypothetical protein [Streptomyces sp. NBC_00239]|uniref:hypothetical protein n=1 Tax=Streptomyces sp. NBC_00239 TaxID=2903640 RepID=UPI002E28FE61|nr:hypothetical protein [Streptomyces sp. NBC_00239]